MSLTAPLKSIFFTLVLIYGLNNHALATVKTSCTKSDNTCVQSLINYPLFDNAYLIAANYVPVLPLRALAHAEIYKNKKSAEIVREFFVKDLAGNFSKPYEKIDLLVEVKAKGLFGREIIARGTLNEFKIEYKNIMTCSLPKNAHMEVEGSLDGLSILNLSIDSDGTKMTNKVLGKFFAREVNYITDWRDTKGILAGYSYILHTEGVNKESSKFKAVVKGKIGNTDINGSCEMLEPNHYVSSESYGPILVKTDIRILE